MKLEIESVTVKNFLSFGRKLQEIPFKKGVNIVLGKDLATGRSNGAGKSSFLETIPFALFGQTHKELKKEQLINWNNRKKTEVRLSLKKSSDTYTIVRTMKPDQFEVYQNDSLIEKEAHARDYQKMLEEIIGINFQTFGNLVHSNLNSSNRILSLKKPEKRKFIENVFGLLIYSQLDEKAKERIKQIDVKLADFDSHLYHNKLNINGAVTRLDNLNTKIKNIGSSEIQLKDARIELEELIQKNPNISKKLQKVETYLIESATQDTKITHTLTNTDSKIRWVNRRIKENNEKLEQLTASEDARKTYKDFVKKHGKPSEIVKKIDEINNRLNQTSKQLDSTTEKQNKLKVDIASLEAIKNEKSKALSELKNHDICPTCKQTLKSENTDVLKTLSDEITTSGKNLEKLQKSLVAGEKHQKEIEKVLEQHKDDLNTHNQYRDELYRLKDKITTDLSISNIKNNIKRYKKVILKLDKIATKLEKLQESINTRIKLLEEDKQNIDKQQEQINLKKRNIENLEKDVKNENARRNEFLQLIETEQKSINKLTEQSEEINKQKEKYSTLVDYLKTIREICKDDRIKQYAISSIMPYLNQQTNHYLAEVGYGFYAVLDRWLEAEIKGPGIKNASYGSLSSGEARGIDLALQFALLDIARIQAGIWPDIIVMDEILDSSVDNLGVSRLMDIIRVKQRQEDNKLFIISHRDEISEDLKAERVYFAKKEKGYTHIDISDVRHYQKEE